MLPLGLFVVITLSREMVLSKDGFHLSDQCIDNSYRFNFGYFWFNIIKLGTIQI